MSIPTSQQAYAVLGEFVETIDRRDSQALQRDFGISSAVSDEIYDAIDGYFNKGTRLSIAPESTAFDTCASKRPFIDLYETNEEMLGIECVIFANGVPGEAILHLEMSACDGRLSVFYKYIGS